MARKVKVKPVITERRARAALRSLGNSAKQIAASLENLGITGSEPATGCNTCPLAMFLRQHFKDAGAGDLWVQVYGGDGEMYIGNGREEAHFISNRACQRFVRMYDNSKFLQLTSGEV